MPKRGKLNKISRDRAMIAGIRKHRDFFDSVRVGPDRWNAAALVALFDEHAKSIEDIATCEAAHTAAVAREKLLERALSIVWTLVAHAVRGAFGKASPVLRDFGLKQARRRKQSIVTKAIAVAKRKATRAARGTMGPKQRAKRRRGR